MTPADTLTRKKWPTKAQHIAFLENQNAAQREEIERLEQDLNCALINEAESEEVAAELFELCCTVVDGKPEAAAARDSLKAHIDHVQKCRAGSCATELGDTPQRRAEKAEKELARLTALIARAPCSGLCASIGGKNCDCYAGVLKSSARRGEG